MLPSQQDHCCRAEYTSYHTEQRGCCSDGQNPKFSTPLGIAMDRIVWIAEQNESQVCDEVGSVL